MIVKLCLQNHLRGLLKQMAMRKERTSNLQRMVAGAQEAPEEAEGVDMEEEGGGTRR